jgi:hypothetical protein
MPIGQIIFPCLLVVLSTVFIDQVLATTSPDQGLEFGSEQLIKDKQDKLVVIQKKLGFLEKSLKEALKEDTVKQNLVTDLGFHSVEELASVQVGQSFEIFHVGLDQLQAFQVVKDPKTLLSKTTSVIYPLFVTVAGKPELRSSATVSRMPGEKDQKPVVRLTQLGSPELIKLLEAGRGDLLNRYKSPCKCFVVSVPALSRNFLGDEIEGRFMIRVLEDGPGKLKMGELLSADQVFEELSKVAQTDRYNLPDPSFVRPTQPIRPKQ